MCFDACSIDLLKVVDGHTQVHIANAFDGQTNGVFAGIEHAVFAGTVVLEQQQAVAVGKSINILGLTGIQQLEIFHDKITSF